MSPPLFAMILDGDTIDARLFPGVRRLGCGPHLAYRLKRE